MFDASDNTSLLKALQNGDKSAFESIYLRFGEKLVRYVASRVRDHSISEEIVQELFLTLWVRREKIAPDTALEAYLFNAAKYKILSHIRSEKVRQRYAEHFTLFVAQHQSNMAVELLDLADLKALIEERISALPPKCQQAFRMSRFGHKTIAEIAEEMGISKRTVENHLTKALKYLRETLSQSQWTFVLIGFFVSNGPFIPG